MPFLPPPTTNQPSLKWTKIIPAINIRIVITDAGFTNLLHSSKMAQTTCDSFIVQASGIPNGAKPI